MKTAALIESSLADFAAMPAKHSHRTPPTGRIFADDGAALKCFYFLPDALDRSRPPLVCIHGISRNALEHLGSFRALAEREGVALIAPVFDRARYRGYQTLGSKRGWNALSDFESLLSHAQSMTGVSTGEINLFGYSGGAQFAHRFALARAERVRKCVLAAAGWYTLPRKEYRYPLGVAGKEAPVSDIEKFLALQMLVMVGAADVERDSALRMTDAIDRLQGENRIARGQSWAAEVNAAALELGLSAPAQFRMLPNAAHSFADCVRAGLVEEAFSFLYSADGKTDF